MVNMRISGLASGMDIDSIVSDMMKVKRIPLDKLKQEKQIKEWQRDDYRSINTLLLNFRSELTQMKLTKMYRTRTTTTSDDSKVTATATSAASLSSFSISEVKQLASAETRINRVSINNGTFDANKSMNTQRNVLNWGAVNWDTGAIQSKTVQANKGVSEVEFDAPNLKTNSINSWSVKVNGIGYQVTSSAPTADNQVQFKDGKLIFKKPLEIDSVIKVDYVATERTDTIGIPKEGNTIKLGQGAINNLKSVKLNTFIDGKISDTAPQMEYRIDGDQIFDKETGELVGTLNKVTGEITLANIPRPDEDAKKTYSLEVTYDHYYTGFKLDTSTSKGDRNDSFLVSASDSLNAVINKVNSASVGVNMFYDSTTGRMTMTRNETGDFRTGNEIGFEGAFIDSLLQFKVTDPDKDSDFVKVSGNNAKFTINGLETNRSSNTFEINGVTFTLKKTFNSTDTPAAVTIAVNNDSNAVFENIKSFIEKYNELIDKIQTKTQEERYKSFKPLTDDDREKLSDKQQEQWEEKAKSGLLRRDPTLTSLLSTMRMDFYGGVESEGISPFYNQLAKIGIRTTANYLEGGKLEINEAELKKAIEADPQSVEKLFNASGDTSAQKGIAQRLYDSVGKTMDILNEKAGKSYSTNNQFTIGKQLNDLNDRIKSFETRLIELEDRYYRQFTAMEKAIQKANQQSAYFMNNFFNS